MTGTAAAHTVAADPMSVFLRFGQYSAVIGKTPCSRVPAMALRAGVFRKGNCDEDPFDEDCLHGCVSTFSNQPLVAFRVRLIESASDLSNCYTGQHYDLSPLTDVLGPILELGRFCQSDGPSDATALRLAWAALGVLVDRYDIRWMIGCSSFPGGNAARHQAELAWLRAHHLGPEELRPKRRSSRCTNLPETGTAPVHLPQLLRSYLKMGGWVSDHAVRDPDLDTLHVFTGLAIDAIPEPRKARLRALARAAQPTPLDLARAAP